MGWEWKQSASDSFKEDVETFNTSCFGSWGKNSLILHGKEKTWVSFFAVKVLAKFSIGPGINLRNPY